MSNLSNVILMQGDTDIATFFCAVCGESFEADLNNVTCVDHQPICLKCIDGANWKRAQMGLPAIPVIRSAYKGGTVAEVQP